MKKIKLVNDLNLLEECIENKLTVYVEKQNEEKIIASPMAIFYFKERLHLFYEDPKNNILDFLDLEEVKKFDIHPLKFNLNFANKEVLNFIGEVKKKDSRVERVIIKLKNLPRNKNLNHEYMYFNDSSLIDSKNGKIWSANSEIGASLMSWLAIQHIKYDIEIISPSSIKEDFDHYLEATLMRAA